MDHLLVLAESAMTEVEMRLLSDAERYLLAASCYIHDLGMTAAAIPSIREQILKLAAQPQDSQKAQGFSDLIRQHHGDLAESLAKDKISETERFVIEDSTLRLTFGDYLGKISASHSWGLARLDDSFGNLGKIPFGKHGQADVGFVACMLRVIDYMDLSAGRASRTLYSVRCISNPIASMHWLSQMNLQGPMREGAFLKYASLSELESIDSWWLSWDLLSGLSVELAAVSRYLRDRSSSRDRFSLCGVIGVESPEVFSRLVRPPKGSLPVDVRVTAASMSKIVKLLGGDTLYAGDKLAPLRELLQNGRDAIVARMRFKDGDDFTSEQALLRVDFDGESLEVGDNGVGMSLPVITDHLLGLGSSYWRSDEARTEFGDLTSDQAGRFGVGFVSVFMISESVLVSTRRPDAESLKFELSEIDRRGNIQKNAARGHVGTCVKLKLKEDAVKILAGDVKLSELIKARAPMMVFPIQVSWPGGSFRIHSDWWRSEQSDKLNDFIRAWDGTARGTTNERSTYLLRKSSRKFDWPEGPPVAVGKAGYLTLDPSVGAVLLCSFGLAVNLARGESLGGMIELGDQVLSVSRDRVLSRESFGQDFVDWARHAVEPVRELYEALLADCRAKLESLAGHGLVARFHDLIDHVSKVFGLEAIDGLSLAWLPILEVSGSYIFCSQSKWNETLADFESAVLVFGTSSPADAYEYARSHDGFDSFRGAIVPIDLPFVRIDYNRIDDIRAKHGTSIKGTFSEVLQVVGEKAIDRGSACEFVMRKAMEARRREGSMADLPTVVRIPNIGNDGIVVVVGI
jgi:hypothetical protein